MPSPTPPIHLIIPTHTTLHLNLCLLSIALQTQPPATITVTCDVDKPKIQDLLQSQATNLNLTINYIHRPHEGKERLAQVRNNAVRFLTQDLALTQGRLLFLDGDTYASNTCLAQHAALGKHANLVLPSRINLDEKSTTPLNYAALKNQTQTITPTTAQLADLKKQQRKAQRHQQLRKLHLTKSHKPKLLGGHHSVDLQTYIKVNGHDEQYHTWGTEDDDFARRAYQSGAKSIVAINEIIVYHLFHPTRGSQDWHDRENAQRFKQKNLPIACEQGLTNPHPQAPVQIDLLNP